MLLAKKLECPNQLWMCGDDGVIALKYNLNMVLTVATPPKQMDNIRHNNSQQQQQRGMGYEVGGSIFFYAYSFIARSGSLCGP